MAGREGGCRAAGRRCSGANDATSEASRVASVAEPAAGGAAPARRPAIDAGLVDVGVMWWICLLGFFVEIWGFEMRSGRKGGVE